MKNLSNTKAELKKALLIKKACNFSLNLKTSRGVRIKVSYIKVFVESSWDFRTPIFQTIYELQLLIPTQRRIQNPINHLRWVFFLQKQVTIFAKSSIIDFWQSSQYASANYYGIANKRKKKYGLTNKPKKLDE